MKIICTLLLFVSYNIIAQVSVDTTAVEYKEHIKQEKELYEKAKKETEEKKLKPSIFGTQSDAIGFGGFNYDSYADGIYSEVAKSENWSKWSLPDDMDAKLEAFEKRQLIRNILISIITIIGIFLLLWILIIRKRKIYQKV